MAVRMSALRVDRVDAIYCPGTQVCQKLSRLQGLNAARTIMHVDDLMFITICTGLIM
jgi:hypothetical protein